MNGTLLPFGLADEFLVFLVFDIFLVDFLENGQVFLRIIISLFLGFQKSVA